MLLPDASNYQKYYFIYIFPILRNCLYLSTISQIIRNNYSLYISSFTKFCTPSYYPKSPRTIIVHLILHLRNCAHSTISQSPCTFTRTHLSLNFTKHSLISAQTTFPTNKNITTLENITPPKQANQKQVNTPGCPPTVTLRNNMPFGGTNESYSRHHAMAWIVPD